jgi:hypothetical protein
VLLRLLVLVSIAFGIARPTAWRIAPEYCLVCAQQREPEQRYQMLVASFCKGSLTIYHHVTEDTINVNAASSHFAR